MSGKKQKLSQPKREEELVKWLRHYQENGINNMLSVQYLFYDLQDNSQVYMINPDIPNEENTCVKCNKEFFIQTMYDEHIKKCNYESV